MATPMRLILASASPARHELLTKAGYAFEVMPAHIDEPKGEGFRDARTYVHTVAWLKAAAVTSQVAEGLILATDTVGWLDGQVIGKPADEANARRILTTLGGREHELWSGVVLWRRPDNLQIAWQELTRVHFKQLTPAEMEAYLATRTWQGCSGAYAIQEKDDPYVRVVEGSWSNVVGLPMETLERVMSIVDNVPRGTLGAPN